MEIPSTNQDTVTGFCDFHQLSRISQVKVSTLKYVNVKLIRLITEFIFRMLVSCWYLWIADSSGRCNAARSVDMSVGKRSISVVSFKAFLLFKYTHKKTLSERSSVGVKSRRCVYAAGCSMYLQPFFAAQ